MKIDENTLKRNFSKNLRFLRLSTTPPIAQTTLGKKIGTTQKSISNYEKGKCLPPLLLIMEICAVFNVTVEELLLNHISQKGLKSCVHRTEELSN